MQRFDLNEDPAGQNVKFLSAKFKKKLVRKKEINVALSVGAEK